MPKLDIKKMETNLYIEDSESGFRLNFNRLKLGDEGAIALGKHIETGLIGLNGFRALISTLHTTLDGSTLNVSGNNIGDAGIIALITELKQLPHKKSLTIVMQSCNISALGARTLLDFFTSGNCRSNIRFDIRNNPFSNAKDTYSLAVIEALKSAKNPLGMLGQLVFTNRKPHNDNAQTQIWMNPPQLLHALHTAITTPPYKFYSLLTYELDTPFGEMEAGLLADYFSTPLEPIKSKIWIKELTIDLHGRAVSDSCAKEIARVITTSCVPILLKMDLHHISTKGLQPIADALYSGNCKSIIQVVISKRPTHSSLVFCSSDSTIFLGKQQLKYAIKPKNRDGFKLLLSVYDDERLKSAFLTVWSSRESELFQQRIRAVERIYMAIMASGLRVLPKDFLYKLLAFLPFDGTATDALEYYLNGTTIEEQIENQTVKNVECVEQMQLTFFARNFAKNPIEKPVEPSRNDWINMLSKQAAAFDENLLRLQISNKEERPYIILQFKCSDGTHNCAKTLGIDLDYKCTSTYLILVKKQEIADFMWTYARVDMACIFEQESAISVIDEEYKWPSPR